MAAHCQEHCCGIEMFLIKAPLWEPASKVTKHRLGYGRQRRRERGVIGSKLVEERLGGKCKGTRVRTPENANPGRLLKGGSDVDHRLTQLRVTPSSSGPCRTATSSSSCSRPSRYIP